MYHVHELQHPLVDHHLSILRDVATPSPLFRLASQRLTTLLIAEASRELPLTEVQVQTPMQETECMEIQCTVGLLPILRAGLMMVDPVLHLFPDAEVWHLGFYRNEESLQPVAYYEKLAKNKPVDVAFVLDPMLATGGSACAALDVVKRWGVPHTVFLGLLAAPEGIERVNSEFPSTPIYLCAIDEELNEKGYIIPGLGDAGDRAFNAAAR